MFDTIKNLGNIQKLQQQASQMQSALKQEEIVVERDGVRIVMRGDQQIMEVTIDGVQENRVAETVNEAVQKTQQLAARKLIEMSQNSSE